MRLAAALFTVVSLAGSLPADAKPRRLGPPGRFTNRHITVDRNELAGISAPLSSPAFGQRIGDTSDDGGFRLINPVPRPLQPNIEPADQSLVFGWRAGVAVGIFNELEISALFIPVQFTPGFVTIETVPVILTYALTFGDVDVGARLNFHLGRPYKILPGVPVRVRLGRGRLDTGVFTSVSIFDDLNAAERVGLIVEEDGGTVGGINVPIRYAHNLTARFFAGLESGFVDMDLGRNHTEVVPVGFFFGYTLPWGNRVVDIAASFVWDNLFTVDPGDGQDTVNGEFFRANFGFTSRSLIF